MRSDVLQNRCYGLYGISKLSGPSKSVKKPEQTRPEMVEVRFDPADLQVPDKYNWKKSFAGSLLGNHILGQGALGS